MPDVLVIGGGIAGVSIAYELAEHCDVLLVEAEPTTAVHTTGRSAALYIPTYGAPLLRDLTVASGDRFTELASILDTPPLLTPRGELWIAVTEEAGQRIATLDLEPLSAADAVRFCPVLRAERLHAAAYDDAAMDVDVMSLHQGYARGLRARGGRILTSAPVRSITRSGASWQVTAGDEIVSVGTVVNAAGAWADQVAGLAGVPSIDLRPMRRTVAIAAGTAPVDRGWPSVTEIADEFYFKPEGDRVLISPADETPDEPGDAKPEELDIALAMDRVNEATTLGLRSVSASWAGLRSFVPDRHPVVGAWPEHPGFHFFAAQGGNGIQMAPALAVLGAQVVLGRDVDGPVDPAQLAPRISAGW
ncbi:FAD-binding oxidoreductase [Pseudonocardiaceae bacterium YIM PH 21723]|nr:FAD-binding oxidoreductase [Pseudonocardiaceae bacterium YIM PH 21723]